MNKMMKTLKPTTFILIIMLFCSIFQLSGLFVIPIAKATDYVDVTIVAHEHCAYLYKNANAFWDLYVTNADNYNRDNITVGMFRTGSNYKMCRGILYFDLTGVNLTAVVSAKISLKVKSMDYVDQNFNVSVYYDPPYSQRPNIPIEMGDYNYVFYNTKTGSLNVTEMSEGSYVNITISGFSGVQDGCRGYMLRSSRDADQTEPADGVQEAIGFYTALDEGSEPKMYLTVEDTSPPTCSGINYDSDREGALTNITSYWEDTGGLSGIIYSTNVTSAWTNSSWVDPWTGSPTYGWYNTSLTLPEGSLGLNVGIRMYVNDTLGKVGLEEEFIFVLPNIECVYNYDGYETGINHVDGISKEYSSNIVNVTDDTSFTGNRSLEVRGNAWDTWAYAYYTLEDNGNDIWWVKFSVRTPTSGDQWFIAHLGRSYPPEGDNEYCAWGIYKYAAGGMYFKYKRSGYDFSKTIFWSSEHSYEKWINITVGYRCHNSDGWYLVYVNNELRFNSTTIFGHNFDTVYVTAPPTRLWLGIDPYIPMEASVYYDDVWLSYVNLDSFISTENNEITAETALYFRSDTWTVNGTLGYKLMKQNTFSSTSVSIGAGYIVNVGVRIWYYDEFRAEHELTGGSPEAVVSLASSTSGVELHNATFECENLIEIVDHLKVIVYMRSDGGAWVAKALFLTGSGDDDIAYYLDVDNATCAVYYYLNFTIGDTFEFHYGDRESYNSKLLMNIDRADPWRTSAARLKNRDIYGMFIVPWVYIFGNVFWTILYLGVISLMIIRHGSYKMVLLISWILGGSGSLLWALVPSSGLVVAAIMLAFAMAGSLFKLFHR